MLKIIKSTLKIKFNFVLQATYFGPNAPILIFGIMSFIAGLLSFLFPETKDKKLKNTIKEVEFVEEVSVNSIGTRI